MKKLMLSTALIASTAGFALAQEATTTPNPATEAPAETTMPSTTAETAPEATTGMTGTDTAAAEDSAREGYSPVMAEAVTTENLEGARVYSSTDEWVGDVSELVVDDAGQVTEVIVDVGGFLGIGAKPVALTMTEMEILKETDGEDIRAFVPMTKEDLEALPEYQG